MFGLIDAGGTTFKCALASAHGSLLSRRRVNTRDPGSTVAACVEFFRLAERENGSPLVAVGLACFGPLDVDPESPRQGTILETPKAGWSGFNLKAALEEALRVRVCVQTDVNAALLAEIWDGSCRGARSAAYVTVGTGIGVGLRQGSEFIASPSHAEMGHLPVAMHPDDSYAGNCPFHGNCLEGLASARAFEARWGPAREVPPNHPGWKIEADYLAQLCMAITLVLRPEKIALGGGLMQAEHLLALVRERYLERMAGYLSFDAGAVNRLLSAPAHGDDAGLQGALALVRTLGPFVEAPSEG
ncbi:MAG: ROK family protein [Pseudomonadota bacterium]